MELVPFSSDRFNESLVQLYKSIFKAVIGYFMFKRGKAKCEEDASVEAEKVEEPVDELS
ncbi:hypothetical protein OAO55_01105 [Bacteroidales bacterium]|nr:hypothetical protein [Bacteroidales bacterium]